MKKFLKTLAIMATASVVALSSSCSFLTSGNNSSNDMPLDTTIILENVEKAKNVILLIGDGMGQNQIKAGELYKGEKLCMQNFPYCTTLDTHSEGYNVTDSAAAATALATGKKTTNGDVNVAENQTLVDIANSLGKRTGIIATEEIYGATPMGFSGHATNRSQTDTLIKSAAQSSNVNMFLSYSLPINYRNVFIGNGYSEIAMPDMISESTEEKIIGTYAIKASAPSLSVDAGNVAFDGLIVEALEYLSKDEDGFFLMAEGSHIDHGGHANDMMYMLNELLAFDDGVKAALEWAKDRDDTVVIVTADHETGGLWLSKEATKENLFSMKSEDGGMTYTYENFQWTTTGHSGQEVYCYINGANIDFSQYYIIYDRNMIENTSVFDIIKSLMK